jgi:hypothetical protein
MAAIGLFHGLLIVLDRIFRIYLRKSHTNLAYSSAQLWHDAKWALQPLWGPLASFGLVLVVVEVFIRSQ